MDHLDLLATLASNTPSIPANTTLGSRDDAFVFASQPAPFPGHNSNTNNDNSQNSDFQNDTFSYDFSLYDMGYMPLYNINSTSDYPSSSPSRPTGYKRPSSPTPLLGTSPKRAHFATHNDDLNWSSSPLPILSTVMTPLPAATGPVKRPVGRPRKPVQMSPAAQTTPSLQGPPRSPVLIETKPDIVINKGNWALDELSTFYEYCLGQDADATFQKITMSSNKCWKGFVGKVGVLRDSRQLKTQWDASLGIYKKLVPLIKFTGGGADADEEPDWEDKDAVDNFLKSRAAGGHDIEGLSAKKVRQWLTCNWFNLFHSRYGENPKAVREIPRSSADTLSDIEGGLHNDDNDDGNNTDDDIVEVEKPGMPATPASTITKPTKKEIAADPREVKLSSWDRSKPASRAPPARVKKEDRLQGLNNYLEGRVRVDEQAMKLAKADAEFKRLKAAEGMAKEIVTDAMGLYGEETKDKARRVLEKLMDAALNF